MAAFVAGSPTAHAVNPEIADGVCHSTEYCAYQNDAKGGKDADFNSCEPDWYCGVYDLTKWEYYQSATIIDNQTSSLWARGSAYPYVIYAANLGGGGQLICRFSGSYFNQATLSAVNINNRISSMWTSPTNDCTL